MMLPLLLLLQAATSAPPPAEPEPADIVVVAQRKGCNLAVADRELSWGEVDNFARAWGLSRPVRVKAPANLSLQCMMKIMERLGRRGVNYVHFIQPTPQPAPAAK